ncbi:Exonuclease-Endonuclease-Phosphatase protein [Pandoravirus salinus]|uniref:Exonuclease-Endonuclease-Phosphatase protein n=1 Tax=Pandoravirus salinus TaxID=1349410 RepID=S4VYB7_9VIRU|nr:Exonuclease-Endonuclease-Phosphatase superfamily protein [Pandoravirus salinus]AGO85684.1 Exonuclease-Endonuclease-Phosphatase protein [Pandoravirus salinus]
MHKNLHINPSAENGPQHTAVVVLQWNVDDAVREEAFEQSRWSNRVARIVALIGHHMPDIMCLQEVTQKAHRDDLIARLAPMGYDAAFGRRNTTTGCTSNLVAWKSDCFHLCATENLQLLSHADDHEIGTIPGDAFNSKGWGANLFVARLVECAPESVGGRMWLPARRLDVASTHFPVDGPSRDRCIAALCKWISQRDGDGDWIVAGDLNTFGDKGGPQQIASLADAAASAGGTLVGSTSVSDQTGETVAGTFFGFDHDRVRFPLGGALDALDHVAVGPAWQVDGVVSSTRSMLEPEPAEWSTTSLPSDHLPLLVHMRRRQPHA